jgi:hypothetical protein
MIKLGLSDRACRASSGCKVLLTKWASVSLAKADVDLLCVPPLEDRLDWMARGMVFTPAAATLRRLRALQMSARHLAEDAPGLSARPEAVDLEQAFIQALFETVDLPVPPLGSLARQHQQAVISRVSTRYSKRQSIDPCICPRSAEPSAFLAEPCGPLARPNLG